MANQEQIAKTAKSVKFCPFCGKELRGRSDSEVKICPDGEGTLSVVGKKGGQRFGVLFEPNPEGELG